MLKIIDRKIRQEQNEINYVRKNTQHKNKRYAQSLFVAVTARIIHKNILEKNDDFKSDVKELETIMQNFGLCKKILVITDKVVTKFLEDSAVEAKIEESNTAHNFFSNQVYGNDMLKIIDRKIRQEQNEINYVRKNTQHKNKRYAQSLFVAVTARIIHKNILEKNDDFKSDVKELETIMQNFGLCKKILVITDKVVTKFLEDSAVEAKIEESNTAHNFFSNQVYGNDMLKIIDRKIRQEQNEINYVRKIISGI
jgi:hypothetical protein